MTETITIAKDEYDRLIAAAEDAEDNAVVADHLANPEIGMPSDLVARMIDGENPLAIHREWRGLSAAELSRRSEVNRVQIVNIEAGKKNGSVATMKKLADALGVRIDDII